MEGERKGRGGGGEKGSAIVIIKLENSKRANSEFLFPLPPLPPRILV